MEIMTLPGGIQLYTYRDSRFKQGALSIQFIHPMTGETAAMNALFPAVLLRGTTDYPDMRAITLHLDDLYGASVSTMVRRVGDYQTTGLYCNFMEDRFALDGDNILEPMLEFVGDLLTEPLLEQGAFCPGFVDSEKKNLISTIESEINDKRIYASSQLIKLLCKGDTFAIPRLGTTTDVEKITPQSLYDHYRRVLEESPVLVFYVGSAQPETVADLLTRQFAKVERRPAELVPQSPLNPDQGSHLEQSMDVSQAKLCMGFVTPVTNQHRDFAAMQVMNTIFGGGMTSKLFMNVRERLSLCYSVGSVYYGTKGIVTVSAGIDEHKNDIARAEILAQLEDCRNGKISPEELTAAKEAVLSALRIIHDSPSAIEGYYATAQLSGIVASPEERMLSIAAVTTKDVVRVANQMTYHSSFLLKGK